MKLFLKKVLLFSLLNFFLLWGVLAYFSGRKSSPKRNNGTTESNLAVMENGEHYDIAILGASRGRGMSRDSNHTILESMLNKRIINLSKGGGGGVVPAEMFLTYFYNRENTADHIIYFLDPQVMYDAENNEKNGSFMATEPFELGLLAEMISMRLPIQQQMIYLKSIWSDNWEDLTRKKRTLDTLREIDYVGLEKVRKRYDSLIDMDNFVRYSAYAHDIIALARSHNATVSIVMLPFLMKDFPGKGPVADFFKKEAATQSGVYFYDFTEEMRDRLYFYDHAHFNRNGMIYFTKNYLEKIVLPDCEGSGSVSVRCDVSLDQVPVMSGSNETTVPGRLTCNMNQIRG
ncbi:MAG TPA: hypothetical protein VK826_19080 [Bacteroidia bacterium]|nr:hypothetical protein [Bacteroidia bacterium]